MTESALSDIRVIDLTGETGAYATKLLADLGADVIRIEPPDGDPLRNVGPFWHDEGRADRGLYFFNLNTSKRSMTLGIADPKDREIFRKLAGTADVVVESFEPGVLDDFGLGYKGLSKIKPDIILTSITGFGQTGPHAHYKWSDIVGVAMSGMMTLAGDKEDPPNRPYGNQGYVCAGIDGAAGTMMALVHRDNTGQGQHVDVSMQEALSINQETAMMTWDMNKRIAARTFLPEGPRFAALDQYVDPDGGDPLAWAFGALGVHDRQHRVGDPGMAGRVLLLLGCPERQLALGEEVFGFGEGRHPAPVVEPRVPADMVGVHVRAHDVVDVADAESGCRQVLLVTIARQHVPERARGARLVVADAAVDQDGVVRGLHDVALDAQDQPASGIDVLG